jgi:hypothetical protein
MVIDNMIFTDIQELCKLYGSLRPGHEACTGVEIYMGVDTFLFMKNSTISRVRLGVCLSCGKTFISAYNADKQAMDEQRARLVENRGWLP